MSFKTLAIAMLFSGAAFLIGCKSNPAVLNIENSQISASSKASLVNVRKAIMLAGIKSGWQMQPIKDGHMLATLHTTGQVARIDIKYNTETYNILYKDSDNLQYDGSTIDARYNYWVEQLHRNIRSELAKL